MRRITPSDFSSPSRGLSRTGLATECLSFLLLGRPAVRYLSTLWPCSTLRHCRPAWASSQVVDAGSHLYSAQQDSVRSRTLSEESYGLSWVTPSPLRSLGLCSPSLISDLIIAHISRFVKTFFLQGESPSSLSGGTVFREPF